MKPRISTQLRNCSYLLQKPLRHARLPVGIAIRPFVRLNSTCTRSPNPNSNPNGNDGAEKIKPGSNAPEKTSASLPPASPPLEKQLIDIIKMNGPIPLALYMKQCLTDPIHGYYTASRSPSSTPGTPAPDPFGAAGDFITSPEISQMFGEMLGIWIFIEWKQQGEKDGLVLMELGPGRGTLMADVLRTLNMLVGKTKGRVDKVVLVEASEGLREKQWDVLCGGGGGVDRFRRMEDGNGWWSTVKNEWGGMRIEWYEDWELVPKDTTKSPYILAHEFFDALPIHAFQATPNGWRELLVTHRSLSNPSPSSSPTLTPPDPFYLILSPTPTPYSLYLPTLSPRHPSLLKTPLPPSSLPPTIEISPQSLTLITSLSHHLSSTPSGALLIIDYGPAASTPSNSFRGVRNHTFVSPFTSPGEVDISADVDFLALAEQAIAQEEGVEVHGPMEQGPFLLAMGIRERMRELDRRGGEEGRRAELERLVGKGRGGMGGVYKVMAVVKERGGRPPPGFGGGFE